MNNFQQATHQWVLHCFGQQVSDDIATRCFRFFEEAGELCQALGMTKEDAMKLVNYTWGREPGVPSQELGGVMVTLAALCTPAGLDMHSDSWRELTRCWANTEKIRAKQKAKAQIGLGTDPIPGCAEAGTWVTLIGSVGDSRFTISMGTRWQIVGEEGENWIVNDPTVFGSTVYRLPKIMCTEPRDER